ncbi:uncharacterized protein redic1 [Halichoeres trimaculatus]|uniref:uncharacterized protein redic1 n=1 Tax=Halichoeres trimaculatus TaxID=147232 RepID=UPI003D9F6A86
MKNDEKKQREFFQKRKVHQKLENMGITQPASPRHTTPGSMDLLTLFIVNQIASKKENTDPPKVAVMGNLKGGSKHKRNDLLVLPMSPCSPSKLNLVENQTEFSLQGERKEKNVIPQGFKCQQFQPFSQPRATTDSALWSERSNLPFFQLETPKAAKVLFGSPDHEEHDEHEATFSFNQPEDTEPMLDFTLNHLETEQQFVEDGFRGFSTDEHEGFHFAQGKPKIYLRDESPVKSSTAQTVPVSQCMDIEEEKCFQLCLKATASSFGQTCCDDDDDDDDQRHIQPSLRPQISIPQMNHRDTQEVKQSVTSSGKAVGGNSHQLGSSTVQIESPVAVVQAQGLELCKCKETSKESQDVGTQTDDKPTARTCDASTQCSFVVHIAAKVNTFLVPSSDVSVQHPATGRQTDTT